MLKVIQIFDVKIEGEVVLWGGGQHWAVKHLE